MRSSTLSPKIQRYNMFGTTCQKPAWRNMLLTTVGQLNDAGTSAYCCMNASSSGGGSSSSWKKTSALTMISPMVTMGTVRDGMTSLSGNIAFNQYDVSGSHPCLQRPSPALASPLVAAASRQAVSAAPLAHRYNQIVAPTRHQLGSLMKLVAAAYVLALAVLPFAHHDLVCHLKSSTHCWTCHVGTSADESRPDPAATPMLLCDAGRADEAPLALIGSRAPSSSSGRSPPRLLAAVA